MVGALASILGIIVLFSMYDFLTSRSWLMVTASDRNESVFEDRNKRYGAYKIRRDYNVLVIIIMLSVSGAIGASYGISLALSDSNNKHEGKKEKVIDMSTFADDEQKEKDKVIEPLDKPIPEEQRTIAFVPPVIVDKPSDDDPQIVDPNIDVSTKTQAGGNFGTPDPEPEPEPEPEKPKAPEIVEIVEEDAEYPGGQAAMAEFLRKNMKYPEMALDQGIGGRVYLRFVISENGNISNVRVTRGIADCPECDAEAKRVVEKMPPWKPGKNNGKAVNMWYNLPIKFNPGN